MKNSFLLLFFLCIYGKAQIWVNPLTTGRPLSTHYLGDQINPFGNWYFNYEIGQATWDKSEVGIGQSSDGVGWDWTDANYYENGAGSNKKVRRDIASFRFANTGAWFVTGRARGSNSDPWTYTDEGTWTNNTSLLANSTTGNCAYFLVNPLENPTSFTYSCGATNKSEITLSWNKWNTKDVIVLRNQTGIFSDPTQGQTYNASNIIGDSQVVYRGNATSFTDHITIGSTYYYKVYSENWSYYSAGTVLSAELATTTASPATQTADLYASVSDLTVSVANAVSYQWYRNTVANNYGGTIISNATSSTYEPPTGPSATFNNPGTNYYYAIATTGAGSCDKVTSSVSAVTVNNSNTADWANIQFPKVHHDLYDGIGMDVFAQVYIKDATPGAGKAPNVTAWIGYSTINNNPNQSNWTWVEAIYNDAQAFRVDYNDEYWIKDFGRDLPAGTYYVASRFLKDGGGYVYGAIDGTTNNESGGIWDGATYFNLELKNTKTVTWDGSSWNNVNGPTITSPAIIAGDTNSPPSFSAKKLTINNNVGLTISTGQSVILADELINNNGSSAIKTLVVESGANFIQNNPSASNYGNIRVKRGASVPGSQYNLWSSPVSGQDLYSIYESGTPVTPKQVFNYNTLTDYYKVVTSGTFGKGVGYSIKGEDFGMSNAVFFGTPNNGDVTVRLLSSGQRYNLIGNPYASNIDAGAFYVENQAEIGNTLWFWDNTGNKAPVQMGSGYANYATNNFAIYNVDSEIGNPGTGTQNDASKIPDGQIVTGQGFIIQAKNGVANPSITFKNNMRTAEKGVFFARQNKEKNAFWLQLKTSSQLINTTAIIYKDNAQNTLDKFDSPLASLSSDALFTFADNDSKKLSIQGRAAGQLVNDVMRLGAQFFSDGLYTFALKDKNGIFANGQSIYLHDKKNGIYTDLQKESYVFSATKGLDENRFEIVYKENSVLGNDETKISGYQIYRDGFDFVIQSNKNLGKIEVYNMTGQLLKTFLSNGKIFRIFGSDLSLGAYIIRSDNSGDVRSKKIIR